MGTRQAKMQRRIESAHQRYAGTLLALGMPRRLEGASLSNETYAWYDGEYRDHIRAFYIACHQGTPAPGVKTTKKFIRGYISWLRRQVNERDQ